MFSKTSKEPVEATPAPAPVAAAVQPTPIKRANTGRGGAPSVLSADVVIKGMILSLGDIQVDGRIEGDIRATSLVIGEKAAIIGDVFAEEANVRGRVEGGISARKVQLAATCHVSGNILHETLSVEAGAFFEGNCRHSDNPLADAPDAASTARPSEPEHHHRKAAKNGSDGAANFAPVKA